MSLKVILVLIELLGQCQRNNYNNGSVIAVPWYLSACFPFVVLIIILFVMKFNHSGGVIYLFTYLLMI